MTKEKLNIRFAEYNDIPIILKFIKDLAEYEQMLNEVVATEELLKNIEQYPIYYY